MDKRIIFIAGLLLSIQLGAQNADTLLTVKTAERADSARLEKASGLDIRARLGGLIPGLDIIEHHGQTTYSTSNLGSPLFSSGAVSSAAKGLTGQTVFVDGVPVPLSQFWLQPIQIESIEFVSDVHDKNGLVPFASQGAVYIRTRQGYYNSPMRIDAYVESGVGVVDKMPEWSDGVTYARLNNQAREASGYSKLYSDADIAGFTKGDMYDKVTPNVDYRSLILRDVKPMTRFGMAISGGSARVKYNFSFTGLNEGDLYKVGPYSGNTQLNMVLGVTTKIGNWLEAGADFKGLLGIRRGNRSSLYAWRSVPAVAFPVALGLSQGDSGLDDDKTGTAIYTVSRSFTTNPYAETVDGGFFTAKSRSGMFRAHLDVDFGFFLKGLKSVTAINFGSFYYTSVGKNNDYLAYYWDSANYLVDLSSHLGVKASSKQTFSTNTAQSLIVTEDLSFDRTFGGHHVKADLSWYLSDGSRSGNSYYERLVSGRVGASWSWKNRYAAAFTLQATAAPKYAPNKRWGAFPSGAVTWNIAAEPFMKNAPVVRELKLYAQAGQIAASDVFSSNYRYQASYDMSESSTYGPATAYQWFGVDKQTVKYTTIARFANPDLTWPRYNEFDVGVKAGLDFGLSAGAKFFLLDLKGLLADTMTEYSLVYGWDGTALYENYEAIRNLGGEFYLRYAHRWGDFSFEGGLTATTWKRIDTRVVGDNWVYEWQKRTGADTNAYWGYVCTGKDENGDLVYKDLNDDGAINDNDRRIIGNACPRLRFGIDLNFAWKGLELYMSGTGRAFYDQAITNGYFWNGWGDDNYSAFVAENIGGAYPNLAYVKSQTNFMLSDFWLRKGGFFKLRTVSLSYTFHPSVKWIRDIRLSLTGGDLLTLTKIPYVDPEDMDAGVSNYPFFRTVLAGVKFSF